MFFVYILCCADSTYYIGSTNDLERRLHAHNYLKTGAHYTKIRRPVGIVYFEQMETLRDAKRREIALKKLSRTQKEHLVAGGV